MNQGRDNEGADKVKLFNAINQRDSIIAQRYNDIARKIATSTKEDSIAMSTFTFITALFLPGTFMATFLSITMIDWQPGSSTSPGRSGTESDRRSTQVSKFYWVFWAIDIPLTIIVMLGWWVWFRHAKRSWVRENGIMLDPNNNSKASLTKASKSRYSTRGKGTRSAVKIDTISTRDAEKRSRRTLSIRDGDESGRSAKRNSSSDDLPSTRQRPKAKAQMTHGRDSVSEEICSVDEDSGDEKRSMREEEEEEDDRKQLDDNKTSPKSPARRTLAVGLRARLSGQRPASQHSREQEDIESGIARRFSQGPT